MSKRISPNEMKQIVHEIEYARSRSFYADQNRREEARLVYEARDRAYREHESRMRGEVNEVVIPTNNSLPSILIVTVITSFIVTILNEYVGFVDVSFLKFFLASLPIIFIIGLFKG